MDDYYDLGSYSRPVTTSSPEAQVWCDRGLRWFYGFNLEESVRCYRLAAELDAGCAMAHWGIASASGAYYNRKWEDFTEAELLETLEITRRATEAALACVDRATPVERALIQALAQRYPSDQATSIDELLGWNDAYAAAMRDVYAAFPDDLDVSALFAEAMINRTPWQLWDLKSGEPARGADTLEAVAVLEEAMRLMERRRDVPHPGVLHFYIHVMEMSPHPERALRASDTLRDLTPDAGHLLHMPSHIDILCGDYYAGMVANDRAIHADRKYLDREGAFNGYTFYRIHNYHFKLYAAMFLGQFRPAIDAAEELIATIPEALLRRTEPPVADGLEGFLGMKVHALVRFGRWQEILDEPLPDDPTFYCVTTALWHYAKGIAYAALGQISEAENEQGRFSDALARVPQTRKLFNNTCTDLLAIADAMVRGEIEYRKGNYDSAFAHLRTAVARDDSLPYDEPWGWMQPARHALGALLLEQGRVDEAAQVYRDDLGLNNSLSRASSHPNNVWSLHGYVECLHRQDKHAEAAVAQTWLDLAMARADVEVSASCFCRMGDNCCG